MFCFASSAGALMPLVTPSSDERFRYREWVSSRKASRRRFLEAAGRNSVDCSPRRAMTSLREMRLVPV